MTRSSDTLRIAERRHIALLTGTLTAAMLAAVLLVLGVQYRYTLNERREHLSELAQTQARLFTAIARFDSVHIWSAMPDSGRRLTLSQLRAGLAQRSRGDDVARITVGEAAGGTIRILLGAPTDTATLDTAAAVAQPMRRALRGQAGVMAARGYTDVKVIAAYEPVPLLDAGVVVSIRVSDIRAEFLDVGMLALLMAAVLTIAGAVAFRRLVTPLQRELRDREQQARRAMRLYAVLSEVNQTIVRVRSRDELFQDVCAAAARAGQLPLVWIGLVTDATGTVRPAAAAGPAVSYLDGLEVTAADLPHGQGPTGRAIRRRELVYVDDIATDMGMKPWRERALGRGLRSSAAVPLIHAGVVIGAISVYAAEPHAFDADQRRLLLEMATDITHALDVIAARERLTSQAQVIESVNDAIIATDEHFHVRSWNHGAEILYGIPRQSAIGHLMQDLVVTEFPDAAERELSLGRVSTEGFWEGSVRQRRRDGTWIEVESRVDGVRDEDGRVTGYIAVNRDMTERRALADQLRQAQKMEAVGQLTGGIAHDFNNLLTVIIANAALLEADANLAQREYLTDLEGAARRGADLVHKMLAFSRQERLTMVTLDLAATVPATIQTLRRLLPETIELRAEPADPLPVIADPGAVEQMLMNLATNARDAMPGGGTLTIGLTRLTVAPDDRTPERRYAAPGDYGVVAVSDTGSGMSPDALAHAMEPFFTTKPPGQGSGLGLAMVYGLMKQHNGYILIDSAPGRGTTVRLGFPTSRAGVTATVAPGAGSLPGGTETILVVEDDEAVRRVTVNMLKRLGYTVLVAVDGRAALDMAEAHRGEIALVFSDVVMPRMGGTELARALRERGIPSRVLLASGYASPDAPGGTPTEAGVPAIAKPWSIDALARRLRDLLDAPLP